MEQKNNLTGGPVRRGSVTEKIAAVIVRSRYIIFVLFAAAAVFCIMSVGRVQINSELTSLLPADAETRRAIGIMEEQFDTYASSKVMVSGISYEKALELAEHIRNIEHVADVGFDGTEEHYKDSSALFSVSFDADKDDEGTQSARSQIAELVAPYENYISGDMDLSKNLAGEMGFLLILSALVILAVLLFTSHSYFEIVIFSVVFVFAALLNMGTNYWFKTISSITNTVAIILQLALAIDYAIIFAHRYESEASGEENDREALIRALSKSITEIFSSSLTTVAGLAALTLMQFRLGYDLGIVLIKGIICSMLTVFLLMPGLILLFPRILRKTAHRNFVPNIEFWGKLLTKRVPVFLIVFALIIPAALVLSSRVDYGFSDSSVSEIIPSESRTAMHKIDDTFGQSTAIAVLVPSGDYEKEKIILDDAASLLGVKSATGLANIEFKEGLLLTDRYSPKMLAQLLNVDAEQAQKLFALYSFEYGKEVDELPLVDIVIYLFEKIDQGLVPLTYEQSVMVDSIRGELERGVKQLKGESWDRLVFSADVPVEGEESLALIKSIRAVAERQYGEGEIVITGQITSASDLRDSYQSDSLLISILSVVFVFVILLLTFRSPVAAAILVFVIQGSIWINFALTFICGHSPSFVTNMIVSAIQMGATVDYAIVLMSRYKSLRERFEKREAMIRAVNESFPTVLTSGLIMTVAGLLIAYRISDVYVGHIGLAVGRGAAISVILVLTVLPQLIVLCDKAIGKTTVRLPEKTREKEDKTGL